MTTTSSSCCKPSSQTPTCGCDPSSMFKSSISALPPIDKRGDSLCRMSDKFRMKYIVEPGLYSIGNPDESSPVLVTANYRLTCDHLKNAMEKSNVWVLVINTKGINVWCAAGKGTFGTSELINRIKCTNLETIVRHKNLILPQLGAPGVSAHEVTKATGFRIAYGPIIARDIPTYLKAGNKATDEMRTVRFPVWQRFILTPMELFPALRKFLWIILGLAIIMGIQPTGILYNPAVLHSWPVIVVGLFSIIVGTVVFPILLPIIPFRSFAVKGTLLGIFTIAPSLLFINQLYLGNVFFASAAILFFITLISYLALNFTGCTPFTNISGVKREMRFSVPVYISSCIISAILLLVFKLQEWNVL
jgi:hypothetical protein